MTPTPSTPPRRSADVRRAFIEFFLDKGGHAGASDHGHAHVPSSPVVPHDDPTLMFTNAGMNQFKPVFLGQVTPGSPLDGLRRAVNSQKCIRAGGKHNDLEDVGRDTYHHTFFEMLGNWSFGDYFKEEAIDWAWEFLTEICRLDPDRLYATYFGGDPSTGLDPDEEARRLWRKYLPEGRVLPFGMKDNFWEMGDTGPCGPCSEIHYDRIGDRDAAPWVNKDDPDVIEVWNLVFIQFDRLADASLRALPAKHVDTGMGLERLVSILNNVRSNYDTDLFLPIFAAIERYSDAPAYRGKVGTEDREGNDTAYRVIADHVRTLAFAIADGAVPSNEGRGYVLRRVLRRAVRYARQRFNAPTGLVARLVPVVTEIMGESYPELPKHQERIVQIIREEEEAFGRTLDRGIKLFEEAADDTDTQIAGDDAFKLYDTYGFPLDLTQLMASERGLTVDVAGYERCMEEQKQRSRAGAGGLSADRLELDGDTVAKLQRLAVKTTDDSHKFHARDIHATVRAIWNGARLEERVHSSSSAHHRIGIVLDRTTFYAEMGGQVADHGRLLEIGERRGPAAVGEFRVEDVRSFGGYVLHIGRVVRGELRVGNTVQLHVDQHRRRAVAANHTTTHLLNQALRNVLDEHADQKGSLVAQDRLRFDFAHNRPVDPARLAEVEAIVRRAIADDLTVHADLAPLDTARKIRGLRAVFGETYPDPVRVVSIGTPVAELLADPENEAWGSLSIEFCGGTHLESTGQAEAFALVSEEAVAKGIRRLVALTGVPAKAAIASADRLADRIRQASGLSGASLAEEVSRLLVEIDDLTLPAPRRADLRVAIGELQERVKAANKQAAAAKRDEAVALARQIAEAANGGLEEYVISTIEAGDDRQALQAAAKVIQDRCPKLAVMLLSADEAEGKVAIIASVPKPLIDRGLKAGDWVRAAASACGGKGGGRPEQAQGGGTEPGKIREAIAEARRVAVQALH